MAIKLILLTLLATAVLTFKQTDSIPGFYEDFLFNNLGSVAMDHHEANATHAMSSPTIRPFLEAKVLTTLAKEMEINDFSYAESVIGEVVERAKNTESHSSEHALLVFRDNKQVRSYELTILNNGKTFQTVVSKRFDENEEEVEKTSFYFETYNAEFGSSTSNHVQGGDIEQFPLETITMIKEGLLRSAQVAIQNRVPQGLRFDVAGVTGAINTFCQVYTAIVQIFRSSNTKVLKNIIRGKGFTTFNSTSSVVKFNAVPVMMWDRFLPVLKINCGLDHVKNAAQLASVLEVSAFAESNSWNVQDMHYDKDNSSAGSVDSGVFLTRLDESNMSVAVVGVVTAGSFQLFPDIYVYNQRKIKFGGISDVSKEIREKVPRDITETDLKGLSALMMINSMDLMSAAFGINFKLPTNDPNAL